MQNDTAITAPTITHDWIVSGKVENAAVIYKRPHRIHTEITLRPWKFTVAVKADGAVTAELAGYNVPADTGLRPSRQVTVIRYAETTTDTYEPFSALPTWAAEMLASVRGAA